MSWEAVTWASKQAMKLPQEQLVLLVLANCADPDGVAFSEWRGTEHWWKYLVRRTRLSKSSLFRHINTLLELGLCTRNELVLADGTRRPTIRLDLTSGFDWEQVKQSHSHQRDQSHGETEPEEGDEEANNEQEINEIEGEIGSPSLQSHGETGPTSGNELSPAIPTSGNEPFPPVGMYIDSSNVSSKESPPTPQGGPSASDNRFEEFRSAWLRPIERLSVAKAAWDQVPTAKRGEAIAAAKGYFAWIGKQHKPPAILSAQTFLRENSGWAQWLPYMPDAAGASIIARSHPLTSPEGRSLAALYALAELEPFLRSVMMRNGAIDYRKPVTPQLLALAHAGPKDGWTILSRQQAAAWEGMLRETVTVQVRKHLKEGDRAPWPWPPKKDGTIYRAEEFPASSEETDHG